MSSFLHNVVRLGGGNVAAQVISLAAVPVITRIYSPEEYGAFSFVLSLVLVLFPVSTLRLNSAILLPEDEKTAESLLIMSVLSVLASAFMVMPLLMAALYYFSEDDEVTRGVLWYLVAGVLVHGIVQCYEFWLLRHKQYGAMAWGAVSESAADRLLAIGMGVAHSASAVWLVAGRIAGGAAHLLVLLWKSAGSGEMSRFGAANRAEFPAILRRYKRFPQYSTWAFLLANGGRELPTVALGVMFTPMIAGLYGLGVRVMGFPMLIVGDAIAKVFFRYATSLHMELERLRDSTQLLVRCLIYLMFVPMLVLVIFGPQLFQWVFGADWIEAGSYVQILAMSFLVAFLYRVLSIFFDMFETQAQRLWFDAAQFVGRIGGMLVGGLLWGLDGALWALLLSTVFVQGWGVMHLMAQIGFDVPQTSKIILSALLNLLPVSLALVLATANSEVSRFAVIIAGVVVQVLWLLWREPRLTALVRGWGK